MNPARHRFASAPSPTASRRAGLLMALLLGCGEAPADKPVAEDADADADADVDADADADADVDTGDTGAPPVPCGSGEGDLPDSILTQAWDDGTPVSALEATGWAFDLRSSGGELWELGASRANEGVRFELERPARVYGFTLTWAQVAEGAAPDAPVTAGIYADFGYNGFDYWQWAPLAELDRCAGDVEADLGAGRGTTYVLPEPLEVAPGLLYVGHQRAGAGDKALAFDGSYAGVGDCAGWSDCHSAVNLPEAEATSYFNGLSTLIPYDYLVTLHYVYAEEPSPPAFVAMAGVPSGSRQAWGDYDNDGWVDLLLPGPTLLRNEAGAGFTDVTGLVGLLPGASGGVWGDYDNDGDLDIFAFTESAAAGDTLWRNDGPAGFVDVTVALGIDDLQDSNACGDPVANVHAPSPGAAWLDFDADGDLDLYVPNFICWSDYTYYEDDVYRNDGEAGFVRLTGVGGWAAGATASRGANPADADGDGDVDLLVNNYVLQANLYLENDGLGGVTEAGAASGLAGIGTRRGATTYYGHTIGTAWGDFDNDGDLDAILANLAHPRYYQFSNKTQVMQNNGDGTFTDLQGDWESPVGAAGLRYQETHSVPVLADFDLDGALDLSISAVYPGRPTDLYWGKGDGQFELDVSRSGIDTVNGWGMAAADVDHDGDPDLATTSALFENQAPRRGGGVSIAVVGDGGANRAAIGATIRVSAGGRTFTRHISGGGGQGNQDELHPSFGLGDAAVVDQVEITFPGGDVVAFDGPLPAAGKLWLSQTGRVAEGYAPPAW
jgi:hypothetical protein